MPESLGLSLCTSTDDHVLPAVVDHTCSFSIRMSWVTRSNAFWKLTRTKLLLQLSSRLKSRADKGWAVNRVHSSKKAWCSGLGLRGLTQGLRCGLSIRCCRCHWIVAAWFVFLHFFLIPLCWYAVSERQMLLFFAGGLVGVDKHLFQKGFLLLLPWLYHWIIFSFYYSPMSMLFQNKNN